MSEGYRRRHFRPLSPEVPESICDCERLPEDHCTRRQVLAHAEALSSEAGDAAAGSGERNVVVDLVRAATGHRLPIRRSKRDVVQGQSG